MTLQSEIAGDWEFIDGVEEITFTPVSGSVVNGVKALQRQWSRSASQVFGNLMLQPDTTVWHLWLNGQTFTPRDRDTITEAGGTVWIIGQAVYWKQTSRWMCLAIKQIGITL
jgi:hypothetical protein